MKVIKFPGSEVFEKTELKLQKISPTESQGFLCIGEFNFTCTHCYNKSTFKFENVIFRKVELYCSSCGTLYKITNPAFPSSKSNK